VRIELVPRYLALVAAALGLLFSSGIQPAAADASKPATHTVKMDLTSFLPADITVNAGDTIEWINKDLFPHTATSEAGGFDSGMVLPDKSWTYKAAKKGEFPYICTYHPTMTATLKVK